jgi:quercetin dioxygenase-like cupin family protein
VHVAQDAGGRTGVHKHGGIEPLLVLEGEVELRTATATPSRLRTGDADLVLPETPLVAVNAAASVSAFLVMLATPDGRPIQSTAEPP